MRRVQSTHHARLKGLGRRLTMSVVVAAFGVSSAATIVRVDAFDYEAASGLPSKQIVEPGRVTLCSSTQNEYDGRGNKKSVKTSNCNGLAGTYPGSGAATNTEASAPGAGSTALFSSRTTTAAYTYNADGSVTVLNANAVGDQETRVYGAAFGQLLSLTGPNALKTEWAYDVLGRKTLERRSDGNGTKWTYEYCAGINGGTAACPTTLNIGSANQVTAYSVYVITEQPVAAPISISAQTVGVANGAYTKSYADSLGRIIRTETQGFDKKPDGTAMQPAKLVYKDTTYDALGRVATVSRPYYSTDRAYVTVNQYDKLGRVILSTGADGAQTIASYNGLLTSVTNDKGQVTSKTRDPMGQIVQVVDAHGKSLSLAYDAFGNLVQTTDSAGNVLKIQYDDRGRKVAMQDPDMGSWTYTSNAIGELVNQVDAKSQLTSLSYDKLGRLIAKVEPNLSTNWYYNAYADGSACQMGAGKLCQATANNGYDRKHTYDSQGRPGTVSTKVGANTYTQSWGYNGDGRVLGVTYPSGFVVQNIYSPLGYLWKVVDNAQAPTLAYWKALAMDAEAHLTQQVYGNNAVTTNAYYPETGRIQSTLVGPNVQNISYTYDTLGNLKTRIDALTTVNASYDYDGLSRLKTETLTGGAFATPQVLTWAYDAAGIGNIQSRSDVGTYTYAPSGVNSVRPHAVSGVTGTVNGFVNPSYGYDANGNLSSITASSGGSRTTTWTSYNMVDSVTQTVAGNSNKIAFLYGPEYDRVQSTYTKNNVLQRTTTYLNPGAGAGLFYEEEKNNLTSSVKKKHYLNAGDDTIGVITLENGAYSTQYWHKDHMGSTVVISDASGVVVERMAYEPFGKRRNTNGTADALGTLTSNSTQRGYTEQEMMDEVGLINMNGRIYDPAISRFLSADPTIQAPNFLQSYNRYSYTVNNPLKYFDPTGFSFGPTDGSGYDDGYHYSYQDVTWESSYSSYTSWGSGFMTLSSSGSTSVMGAGLWNASSGIFSGSYTTAEHTASAQFLAGFVNSIQSSAANFGLSDPIGLAWGNSSVGNKDFQVSQLSVRAVAAVPGCNCGYQQLYDDAPLGNYPSTRPSAGRVLYDVLDTLSQPLQKGLSWVLNEIGGANSEDKPSLLDPKGEQHILDGDKTGGGHRPGTGKPGKSEFPNGWSDDRIKGEISDVATDPGSSRSPGRNGRDIVRGTRGGIDIEVIVEPNGRIVTGYPTNVPRNPR